MPESCLGVQPAPVFMGSGSPGLQGGERWVPVFPAHHPGERGGCGAPVSLPPAVPIPVRERGAGRRRGHRSQAAPHSGRPQAAIAGRAPRSSRGPGSPPPAHWPAPRPAPRAPPDLGMRAGAVATNERARRLREPGRLCPPGIGHAVGSGGRGLGGPRAWLGQACCWVTGRRVSPGNGGGYRSLAGREGGGARRRQAPRTPATARGPRPAGER